MALTLRFGIFRAAFVVLEEFRGSATNQIPTVVQGAGTSTILIEQTSLSPSDSNNVVDAEGTGSRVIDMEDLPPAIRQAIKTSWPAAARRAFR